MGSTELLRQQCGLEREKAQHLRAVARLHRQESIQQMWRARRICFDRHGSVVAMWEGEQADAESEIPDRPATPVPARDGRADGLALVTGTAIRHLFGLTLEMSSLLALNHDPAIAQRIRQLIDHSDDLIHDIRLAASDGMARQRTDVATGPRLMPDPSPDGSRAIVLLREASRAIDHSLGFIRRHSKADTVHLEVELEEASWAVHRALIALTA